MVHGYDRGLYANVKLLDAVIRNVLQKKFREEGIAEVDPSQMADREKVWLMTYVLKNEIRSTEAGTLTRAVRICQKEQLKEMLEKYRFKPRRR